MLSPCVGRAFVLTLLLVSFVLVHAAPSASLIPRNVTVDNADSLLRYTPAVCGTVFPLQDPLALNPEPCNGTWITIANSGYSDGTTSSATGISPRFSNVSPSVSFTFAGTAVYWYTTSYPNGRGALAAVKLDGALPVLINTSSLLPGDSIVFNVLGFAAHDLDPDIAHTITVTLVPQPQTAPGEPVSLLDVDAFKYTQVPLGHLTTFSTSPTSTTSPSPTATSPSTGDQRGTFTGALIALSVCGSLLVAAIVASSFIFYYRRRRQRHSPVSPDSPTSDTMPDIRTRGHARGPSLVGPLISERMRPFSGQGPSGGYVY